MNGLNPIIGSIYQASVVQRQAAAERDAETARTQARRKNVGATTDVFEHTVESSDALNASREEGREDHDWTQEQKASDEPPPEDAPRIDLTA